MLCCNRQRKKVKKQGVITIEVSIILLAAISMALSLGTHAKGRLEQAMFRKQLILQECE